MNSSCGLSKREILCNIFPKYLTREKMICKDCQRENKNTQRCKRGVGSCRAEQAWFETRLFSIFYSFFFFWFESRLFHFLAALAVLYVPLVISHFQNKEWLSRLETLHTWSDWFLDKKTKGAKGAKIEKAQNEIFILWCQGSFLFFFFF